MKKQKSVEIYSTPSCHYCVMAKDYFKDNGVEFTAYDVAKDIDKRKEMMDKSGQMGVPVTIVDGEVIVGFDKGRFDKLFGIK